MVMTGTAPSTTFYQVADGSYHQRDSWRVWLVTVESAKAHPDPCGHPPEIGCLNYFAIEARRVFWSRDAAKEWAAVTYNIAPDEWILGGPNEAPDEDYQCIIRLWQEQPGGPITKQLMVDLQDVEWGPE